MFEYKMDISHNTVLEIVFFLLNCLFYRIQYEVSLGVKFFLISSHTKMNNLELGCDYIICQLSAAILVKRQKNYINDK